MRKIPLKLRDELAADPYYERCFRWKEGKCVGRIQWEHALVHAGRQINEKWAILPCCEFHHIGEGLDKNLNRYIALLRATPNDLAKYPKTDWTQLLKYLKKCYNSFIIN